MFAIIHRLEEIAKAARQMNAAVVKLIEWHKIGPVNPYTNTTTVTLMQEGYVEMEQVLEEDIVQFKLGELARPVKVYTDDTTGQVYFDDTTGIMRLVGNNILIVEGVMQDMLPHLVPKWNPVHSEISKGEEQFEAFTSSYTNIFMEEGDIKQKMVVRTNSDHRICSEVGWIKFIMEGTEGHNGEFILKRVSGAGHG